jgi:hypothetical protein
MSLPMLFLMVDEAWNDMYVPKHISKIPSLLVGCAGNDGIVGTNNLIIDEKGKYLYKNSDLVSESDYTPPSDSNPYADKGPFTLFISFSMGMSFQVNCSTFDPRKLILRIQDSINRNLRYYVKDREGQTFNMNPILREHSETVLRAMNE